MFPSEKALKRKRAKLHDMTASRQCFKPIPQVIGETNRHLKGWANYFSVGYPRLALREINTYVRDRLVQHLRRRSHRPFRRWKVFAHTDGLRHLTESVAPNWVPKPLARTNTGSWPAAAEGRRMLICVSAAVEPGDGPA